MHSNVEGQDGCVERGEACRVETVKTLHLEHRPHPAPPAPPTLPTTQLTLEVSGFDVNSNP